MKEALEVIGDIFRKDEPMGKKLYKNNIFKYPNTNLRK